MYFVEQRAVRSVSSAIDGNTIVQHYVCNRFGALSNVDCMNIALNIFETKLTIA